MKTDKHFEQQASEIVLQDLVDCLFAENFFGNADQQLISHEQFQDFCNRYPGLVEQISFQNLPEHSLIWQWTISTSPLSFVVAAVAPGIVQSLQQIRNTPVYAVMFEAGQNAFQARRLGPADFMQQVIDALPDSLPGDRKGAELFLNMLSESVRQTTWSLRHNIDTEDLLAKGATDFFQAMEQWASLRDRPFHPVAKAKMGFMQTDYQRYMAEFGHDVRLHWVAVEQKYLECGCGVTDPQQVNPAQLVLTSEQQCSLRQEMRLRGLSQSHIALPMHPWQLRHVLPKQLATELKAGVCVLLDFQDSTFLATSSVRSMAPKSDSPHYLKLPLGIYSLGASRYLPAVKMINGQRSEKLLRRALALDSELTQRVFICDETRWWAYMPENGSLFDEPPRHLSAMVRSYPPELIEDPGYRLIPMAALGTLLPDREQHFFDDWLRYRQLPPDAVSVLRLFEELCLSFFDINLRLLRIGMLPEVHGQNAVLVWRDGEVSGLLLRDHDSLRLYVPWLLDNGLEDPEYRIKPGHANTLYHDTPEDLLFYLQTLAIQVNLRAIAEALASRYRIDETALWQVIRDALEHVIEQVAFADSVRDMLRQRLFHEPAWPLKLLVKPLIERAGGPGSMPFGKGQVQNPFHHLNRSAEQKRQPDVRREKPVLLTANEY